MLFPPDCSILLYIPYVCVQITPKCRRMKTLYLLPNARKHGTVLAFECSTVHLFYLIFYYIHVVSQFLFIIQHTFNNTRKKIKFILHFQQGATFLFIPYFIIKTKDEQKKDNSIGKVANKQYF